MNANRIRVALPIAIVLAATSAQAGVDSLQFQDLHWRSIGPFRGGRVLTVEGVLSEPAHFYFGAVNGGVWETRDAGRTWQPIFDSAGVGSIGALAIAPSDSKTIYVGTGEADMRSDIAQGIGVFKSTDAGRHWSSVGLADTQSIGKILVDPRDANTVLVAALGHPYGPNPLRGVFRSTDGGKTWTKTLFKNVDTGAIDLAFQPGNPDTVYAALWQTRRPPWNVYPPSYGPGSGFYKSTDGGQSWRQISGHGFPAGTGRIGIGVTPAKPDLVYALIDAKDGGLWRSDDDGENWKKVSGDKRIWQRGWYFSGVTINPKNPDEVYVCDTIVLRSTDGGAHFIPLKGDPTGDDFHELWIDPNNPARRILGSDQGTQITLNGGATWSSWFNQPTGQFYHVITDNRFPYRVYGAQQDSGAASVSSRTNGYDGINMPEFHEITAGGESDDIAPDPNDPDIIYGGRVERLDLKTGQTRDVDPTFAFPDRYRGTWTLPLVWNKRERALYFANQRIFRTTDGGQHWMPISPDLTRPNPAVPSTLDAATINDENHIGPRRGVVYAIGPSPRDPRLIWAGTDDGLVWRTTDGGAHWQNVTPQGLASWSKIGVVEPSHFDPNTAYIAVDRHRLDDFAPYIFRTHDGGKTWNRADIGLATAGTLNSVNVVREDPVRRGLLFAGTERGMFASFDDGADWQPLQSGLPPTSVRDIDIHANDLVIATHGRGFYIMDDIEPLRELALGAQPGARLFAPVPAIRFRASTFTGTPMPKDEPMAPNPPDGAYIDYVLPAQVKGAVHLAITDAKGAPVRSYASDKNSPPPDLAKIHTAPEWIPVPIPLRTTRGEHRFVWDLHFDKPAGIDDERYDGVWAPPGKYVVTLSFGATSLKQGFEVRPDPRIHAKPVDYQREFALARQIESARVRVAAALKEAQKLHSALLQKAAKADAIHKPVLLALDGALMHLADLPPEDTRNAPPDSALSPDGLEGISSGLADLARGADGADGSPSPDVESGFRLRTQMLAQALVQWSALKPQIETALRK